MKAASDFSHLLAETMYVLQCLKHEIGSPEKSFFRTLITKIVIKTFSPGDFLLCSTVPEKNYLIPFYFFLFL